MPVLLACGTGCASLRGVHQREETSRRSEAMLLSERIDILSGRIDDLQKQIDQLWEETRKARQSGESSASRLEERMDSRLADMEQDIAALEAARAADRKEIIDKTTKTVAKLMNKVGGRSASRRISESGVEHTVQPGETLSEIATAYGVRLDILSEANNLKNPDALRAGQKLFIPD